MSEIDTLERPEEVEKGAPGIVRRWLLEIKLATKREKDWRASALKAYEKYKAKDTKRHSFNILWSNTETLRQAVYNSVPKADVRRRFKDDDALGKQVSTVLARALDYGLDTTDFDHDMQNVVLDVLLPGRGLARVRYVPNIEQVGQTPETHEEDTEQHKSGEEALEGDSEEVSWEQAPIEHVQWDDFRIGTGKTWGEVQWEAFRHRLTRDELEEQFGDVGKLVKLDSTDDEDLTAQRDEHLAQSFQTAEVWEVWNKEEREVIFVCQNYKDAPLKCVPDPLGLQGFFPNPRPIYAIEDSTSLVPTVIYDLYKEQAEELNRISARINKLVEGLRNRGIYDASLSEMSEVMKGEDNELVPAQNAVALAERGGLDKFIWMLPIEQAARVIQALYIQRDQTKQTIYELTGISDIMRSASDPSETFGAQKIKTQWGTQRLQRMQKEVARFIRDIIRLQSELIGEKFAPETLATMTGVKLPHQAEIDQHKQQIMTQYQQQAQQAQMTGQQPPPPPQMPPDPITWEAVIQCMRDDKQRTFRVDVETDSTIASTLDDDMSGLTQVLTAVVKVAEGFAPAVQMGVMPMEAVKEIIMTVCRRAKLGNAVEDALDKMSQPKPQEDPNAAKVQADIQKQQMQQQHEQQMAVFQSQIDEKQHQSQLAADAQAEQNSARLTAQLQAHEQQVQAQQNEHQNALESQRAQMQAELDARLEAQRMASEERAAEADRQIQILLAHMNNQARIEVAEISSATTLQSAQMSAASQGAE